ncbi:D-aminoacyl-tRNA deacylase [Halorussus halophilus]|uniref:D-aminoacyl-tRNA deacylase n=1 Tax=Halorussus halophilus TaxID=2650975 RepID=UPI0013012459|nr:D-aminoacyl-tRNA deacylase [Halorussus halophilus]
MIAIVVSRADSASVHIGDHLLDLVDWERQEDETRPDADGGGTVYRHGAFELREFDALHLDMENAADAFGEVRSTSERASAERSDAGAAAESPDLLVFASRHSGDTGPLLTAHFTGNFGPAKYGGTDGGLAEACPNAHERLLSAFAEYAPDEYEVGMECTHHGPSSVGVPSMFAELGSDDPQWEDEDAARAAARAILDLEGAEPHKSRQLVGFGGNHYAPRFTRIARETDWAVGHVAADWCLDAMGAPAENTDVLRRAFEQSRAEYAVIDGDRPELESVIEELGYRVVSETWVRETAGISLDLVADLEAELGDVDSGLRFGELAVTDIDDSYECIDLPTDLLAEAQGIDADAAREAVEANSLAFQTEQSGTRATGQAAIRSPADRDRLVSALADVLARKYDSVEREDGAVVAREVAFDPAKANELGVPEGPKFGKLSAGRTVTVDGEEIAPEQVRSRRVRKFPV